MHKHAITTREFVLAEEVTKRTVESQRPCVTDGGKQLGEGPMPPKNKRLYRCCDTRSDPVAHGKQEAAVCDFVQRIEMPRDHLHPQEPT